MATWEEGIGGSVLTASGLVLAVLVFRRLAPDLTPGLRSFAASGLRLFAEAEFGMQDGIIAGLAEKAVDALLRAMQDGDPSSAQKEARRIVHDFERDARVRSERDAWNHRDMQARYRHHVSRLKRAIAKAARHLQPEQQTFLGHAGNAIAEDW